MQLKEISTELNRLLSIRYIKLHFHVRFTEEGSLPIHKTSALRGGMGEMLLRNNCIRDRDCEHCDFENECIVQKTMYSKSNQKAAFVTNGDSIGYVLECEDQRDYVFDGDELSFNLTLFGRTMVYFNQYLQALYALGMNGIGKDNLHFQIVRVCNSQNKNILDENNVYMQYYTIETISDYVNRRIHRWKKDELPEIWKINFYMPLSIKFQGKEHFEFNVEGIMAAIKRRLYMLDLYEDIPDSDEYFYAKSSTPRYVDSKSYTVTVPRYSFRKQKKMFLKGIKGQLLIDQLSLEHIALLYAGELFHIGKHTSFGFGKYRLSEYH